MTAVLPPILFSLACLMAIAAIAIASRQLRGAWRAHRDLLGATSEARNYRVRMSAVDRTVAPVRRSRPLNAARKLLPAPAGRRVAA